MADIFDTLGEPVAADRGDITDYPASLGESFASSAQRAWDTNPLALSMQWLRGQDEGMRAIFGNGDYVDQKTAEEEIKQRGLDLKVGKGGISRYELDTLQYLKQREIHQNTVGARADGVMGAAAGFAGGVAGSLTDPINIASNFIPFVSEYRYGRWLAQAGDSVLARAAVRVGAGAIEGAAGAAVLEPLVYAGATSQQLDYTSTDSFYNVVFGGVMGGGLHAIGGAVYDARVSRALRGLDAGIAGNDLLRTMAAEAPDHVQVEALRRAVAAEETGGVVDVEPVFANRGAATEGFDLWHGSPHTFDRFDSSKMGTGEGAQAYGDGLYLAEADAVGKEYRRNLTSQQKGSLAERTLTATLGDDAKAADYLEKQLASIRKLGNPTPEAIREYEDAISALRRKDVKPLGSLYNVRVRGKPEDFPIYDGPQGPQAKAFADKARAAGSPGIRYLDQGSRGPGMEGVKPTYNYVVFDDKSLEILSRNGEPIGQSTPRDLGGLIEQAKADRTEAAFNRQFGDAADEATSRAADEAVTKASDDFKPEDIAAETDMFNAHLDSMRERGLVDEDMEAELKAASEDADKLNHEADAYEAAAVCELGS